MILKNFNKIKRFCGEDILWTDKMASKAEDSLYWQKIKLLGISPINEVIN